MRKQADEQSSDLLLVDTGDRIEGNGLYDASKPKGLYQYDIYAQQDVDIICSGNHELYKSYSIEREHNTTVPNFKETYIASNLDYVDPETGERSPLAQRFRRFKTKNQGFDIIALGFMFNFKVGAENIAVQTVEDTIKEDWFQELIREKPDLFVIVGHVGVQMTEFKTIFKALRQENWNSPVAFFGGHAHVRYATTFGADSFAMASGRYMETIGWMSIDKLKKKTASLFSPRGPTFKRTYIDNNLLGMYHHTGLDEKTFPTEKGVNVSKAIHNARQEMQLDTVYGCAPQTYWMSRAEYPSNDSVYALITQQVFPGVVVNEDRRDKSRIAIINTGGIRFDIFKGKFTKDTTFIISPFVSKFKYIPDVPYEIAEKVIGILNSGPRIFSAHQSDMRLMNIPEHMFETGITTSDDETSRVELRQAQESLAESAVYPGEPDEGDEPEKPEPKLTAGFVTVDDIGKDGDDTFHEPIKTYRTPNAVQAEIAFPKEGKPEQVDVVFIDFVQPFILDALKLGGGSYDKDDVEYYMDGIFTEKLAEWIQDNWSKDC